jgi:hypothetical protein
VVVVHGMGEQLPLETLNRFVRTALPKVDGQRRYFSRPERISDSYEARRHLAYREPFAGSGELKYGQTEFFEYHWSYQMTGNKLGDLIPTLRRMLLQRPRNVPYGLKRLWIGAWLLVVAFVVGLVAILASGVVFEGFTLAAVLAAVLGEGLLAAVLLQLLNRAGNAVTKSFVDVVRYLDRSPRSYEVRRAIRKGMVDLLRALHAKGRYSRIVVVAHSLGGYIAYDAISYLWPQMNKLHCGPLRADRHYERLAGLRELQEAACRVLPHPDDGLDAAQVGELQDFRSRQFELWRALRCQGNPWLITDFVTLGTPMYFADLLYTKSRAEFMDLVKRAELPICPPRDGAQTVEGPDRSERTYGFNNQGREVLAHGAPFAVVRWTNLYFPAENSWHGDWFGGPLRPLFGKGILDIPVRGNLPGRRTPGLAHGRYFSYPDDLAADDVARHLQQALALTSEPALEPLLQVPDPLPESDITR